MHPATVHYGGVDQVWKQRQLVMKEAYDRNPEQFVNGTPQIQKPPRKVWINKPQNDTNPSVEQC